jgi:hypothetical protein
MSTAAVSQTSIYQELQTYFQSRKTDLQGLGQALQSGDLSTAQQEFQAIQTLGQGGPFASGNPFANTTREQDFQAVGQALQSGNLSGAQQAFSQLASTFRGGLQAPSSSTPSSTTSPTTTSTPTSVSSQPVAPTSTANGPEIVLNLGNTTAGETITIGIDNTGNGTEQVTIGVANQQNQNPEQITLNLNSNSNEQIVLNLLGNTSTTGTTSPSSSGLNVTA